MLKKRDTWSSQNSKRKEKRVEHMKVPKYWKKREIAHTSKAIIKKRESHDQKEYQKILGLGKYSTHLHILIKMYDLHLLGSGFWLSNICDVSMPLIHTYLKFHSKPIKRYDEKKEKQSNTLVRIIHVERLSKSFEELMFYFTKLIKPLDRRLIKEWMIGNSIKIILSCNRPRIWKSIKPHMD